MLKPLFKIYRSLEQNFNKRHCLTAASTLQKKIHLSLYIKKTTVKSVKLHAIQYAKFVHFLSPGDNFFHSL